MTSTITSAVTPDAKANKRFGNTFAQGNLREAMTTVCTALDALSAECTTLLSGAKVSTKSITSIQRICSQLLAVPNDELKALIDSFELDIVNLNISRLVSDDQGDDGYIEERIRSIAQPLPLMRSWGPVDNRTLPLLTSQAVPSFQPLDYHPLHDDEEDDEDRENHGLYSPNTQDMQSLEPSTTRSMDTNDEDLRRTVGSFDTEEAMEERDAPPNTGHAHHGIRHKWGKNRLSIFNRRTFRRRQAAE